MIIHTTLRAALPLAAALLLCPGGALRAQETVRLAPGAGPGTIRVAATGEAQATPDRAWVDLGVETSAPTAAAASAENARRMEAVIAALLRAGVQRADVETRDYNVFPDYAPPPEGRGEPVLRGYRVTNVVSARTDAVGRVGAVIDAALGAGANRVHGVRFGLRDPGALRGQAIRQAIERGRREAEIIAASLGLRLGRVLDASTTSEPPRPMPVMMEAMMSRAADAPSAPTLTVWLVYTVTQ